jgi:hypothetical protein
MSTDHASIAAATGAGYREIVSDRGATSDPATRYEVTLEKYLSGEPGESGFMFRAFGQGSTQANAEAAALAALNKQRQHRYGGSPGRAQTDANSTGSRIAPASSTTVESPGHVTPTALTTDVN